MNAQNRAPVDAAIVRSAAMELSRPMSAVEVQAQVNLLQEVLRHVMIGPSRENPEGVHYGKIPGTPKPTLYKAGSEKILSTLRIAVDPVVEDLSTPDCARFRVLARGVSQSSGAYLGGGVGEASSDEEKYRWRRAVCPEEFDETPADRRRKVWKKGYDKPAYQIPQVRTNPADVANTVLKMAKKRAQIDMTLTVTAASDIFTQDIEDLPEGVREAVGEQERPPAPPPIREPVTGPLPSVPPGRPPVETGPLPTTPPGREPGDEAPDEGGGPAEPADGRPAVPSCACGRPAQLWKSKDGNRERWYCAKPQGDPTKCAFVKVVR